MSEALQLLHRHLNGEALIEAECEVLSDWVCDSPGNAQLAAELTCLDQAIARGVRHKASAPLMGIDEMDLFEHTINETAISQADLPPIHLDTNTLTKRQYASALSYVLRHTFTPKRVALLATAAAVFLGVLLVSMFLISGPDKDAPQIVEVPDQAAVGGALDDLRPVVVATLTAERDSVWDRRPGEDLYPGQRFTLTEGVAEITTQRGAVAILQAPATIQLFDNDNALYLHTGKLVGICETESSKGFLVRTPFMDVTDLGTRFGVDADDRSTQVHVFEGAVTAIRPGAPADIKPVPISTGESAAISIESGMIAKRALNAERFVSLQPLPIKLPGTGLGLAVGQPDSNWLLKSADGASLEPPSPMAVAAHNAYGMSRDQSGKTPGSWWLQMVPEQSPTPQQPSVIHLIQSGFELAPELDPSSTRLVIACAVDDHLKAIHVNGNRVTQLGEVVGRVHHLTIDQHIKPGHNTVLFEIENVWNNPGRNPIGLFVRWYLLPDVTY